MVRLFISLVALLSVMSAATLSFGEDKKFDTATLLSELEKNLALSQEKLKTIQPTIDAKSKEIQRVFQESVDNGFLQIEEMNRMLERVSRDTEKKVESFLDSDEVQKFKDYLGKLDKEAAIGAQEKLVGELAAVLELTQAQMEELKPVLEESIIKINEMVSELSRQGNRSWDAFKKQYEEISSRLKEKLRKTLDDAQLEKLDKYNQEKKEKIRQTIFV